MRTDPRSTRDKAPALITHQVPKRFAPETKITPGLGTFRGTGNRSTSFGDVTWPPHRDREYEARASCSHSDIKAFLLSSKCLLRQTAQCLSGCRGIPNESLQSTA